MEVFERVAQIGMSHQPLDDQKVGAMLKVVRGKTVAESMRRVWLFYPGGTVPGICTNSPNGGNAEVRAFPAGPFEKIILRFIFLEVFAQKVEQHGRQRYFSLFQPFALLYIDLHAAAVDVGQFDVDTLRHPGTGRINKHDNGPVLEIADSAQNFRNFILRKHERECFGHFGRGQVSLCPLFMVNVREKETEGIVAHFYAARFVVPIGEHRLEITPQFFDARLFRAFADKTAIIIDVPPITCARAVT